MGTFDHYRKMDLSAIALLLLYSLCALYVCLEGNEMQLIVEIEVKI